MTAAHITKKVLLDKEGTAESDMEGILDLAYGKAGQLKFNAVLFLTGHELLGHVFPT